jgi:hypothetical protein
MLASSTVVLSVCIGDGQADRQGDALAFDFDAVTSFSSFAVKGGVILLENLRIGRGLGDDRIPRGARLHGHENASVFVVVRHLPPHFEPGRRDPGLPRRQGTCFVSRARSHMISDVGLHPGTNNVAPTSGPTYDYSEWPVFVVRMPANRLSDDAFRTHLEVLSEPYRRARPFGVLIIMGAHPPLPPVQRRAAAAAMKADNECYPGLLRAKAIVVRSTLERGVVTAVSWMAKPDYPFAAFETDSDAKDWLLAHIARQPAATPDC